MRVVLIGGIAVKGAGPSGSELCPRVLAWKKQGEPIRQKRGVRRDALFLGGQGWETIRHALLLADGQRGADGRTDDGREGCPLGKAQLLA